MKSRAAFGYVQARLQAGHGRLTDSATWQALEASQTLAQYLAIARQGPWTDWLGDLDDSAHAHRIEQQLRQRWLRRVDEVARWLPRRWQRAVRAFGRLDELAHADDPPQAAAQWLAEWPSLLPADVDDAALLRRPADLLLPRLTGSDRGRSAEPQEERAALSRLFRRHAATAVAVLAHLALVALDLERLRGGAVRRCLLPPAGAAGTV